MLDDLPATVARIGDDACESGDLPVEQHNIGPITNRTELSLREKAGGEDDSVDSTIVHSLDMGELHLRSIGDVADNQRRAGRASLGLHPADQRGVVGITDAADHEGQRGVMHRYPGRGISEAPGDFLDALAHGPADAVGIRQRPRHR